MDYQIAATILAAASLAANLTSSTLAAAGSISASASLAADGSVATTHAVAGSVSASASLSATGIRGFSLTGSIPGTASLAAALSAQHALRGRIDAVASLAATASIDGQGLTVRDLVASVLRLFNSGCCTGLTDDACLQAEIMANINANLQLIYSRAHLLEYFNRRAFEVTFANGDTQKTLSQSIQSLAHPVKLKTGNIPLRRLTHRSDFDQFVSLFCNGTTPSSPRAYFLLSENQTAGDNVTLTLCLTPTPLEETIIAFDATVEPPRYEWSDVNVGTIVEMPHRYAELLLMPLMKKWATSHHFYTDRESQPQIDHQYETAMRALGMLDPQPTNKDEEAQRR
jgi:hypothetical protein